MKLLETLLFLTFVAGCAEDPGEAAKAEDASLILTNARVYTLTWDEPGLDGTVMPNAPHDERGWHPDAEAIAIRGGEILFVGSSDDAMEFKGNSSRVIDLAGATVIPGLVDSHTHVFGLGALLDQINLVGVATEEEAVALIVERAKSVPKGAWIVGRGWDEGAWANHYPDKLLLTAAVPDHPVFMDSLHGFAGWGNQAALDEAGISAESDVPVGGGDAPGDRRSTNWTVPEQRCANAEFCHPRAVARNPDKATAAWPQSNGGGRIHRGTRRRPRHKSDEHSRGARSRG